MDVSKKERLYCESQSLCFFTMTDSLCLCCFTQLELWSWAVLIWPAETRAQDERGLIFAQLFAGCAVYFREKHTHTSKFHHTHYLMALPFRSLARVSFPTDSWKSEPSHSLMITAAMREPLWAVHTSLYIILWSVYPSSSSLDLFKERLWVLYPR